MEFNRKIRSSYILTSVIVVKNEKVLGFYSEDPLSKKLLFFLSDGRLEKNETLLACAKTELWKRQAIL
jgi:hypothetical protein